MLVLVVLWNMLNICCGDTRRYIVGKEFGDVWRCIARKEARRCIILDCPI